MKRSQETKMIPAAGPIPGQELIETVGYTNTLPNIYSPIDSSTSQCLSVKHNLAGACHLLCRVIGHTANVRLAGNRYDFTNSLPVGSKAARKLRNCLELRTQPARRANLPPSQGCIYVALP